MRFRIEATHDRTRLGELLQSIDRALAERGVACHVRDDVRLVAEEVLTNAIDHGMAGSRHDPSIVVEIARSAHALQVEFRDDGQPFDPLAPPSPDLDAGILERPVGGLGLHLVREVAEAVSYRRDEPYNVLCVVMRTE